MSERVCVVTGANGGIGRATAAELARRGHRVVMICRNQERGQAARDAVAAEAKHDRVELVLADLSSMAQVRRAAGEVVARHPKIQVLVNNAAVLSSVDRTSNRELKRSTRQKNLREAQKIKSSDHEFVLV